MPSLQPVDMEAVMTDHFPESASLEDLPSARYLETSAICSFGRWTRLTCMR